MSCSCDDSCTTLVSIPGRRGLAGTDGDDGADGVSAFTATTDSFVMPAEGDTVVITVANNSWIAVNQVLYVTGAGWMRATAKSGTTSLTLLNLEDTGAQQYTENASPGTVIASGVSVSPGGLQGPTGTGAGSAFLIANNLSEGNPAIMRSSLALQGMALQDFAAVAITGGNISGLSGLNVAPAAKTTSFNNLSPLTTQGDLLTHDGTDSIRRAVAAAAGRVPMSDGAGDWSWQPVASVLSAPVSLLLDRVGSGVAAEVIGLAAWTTLRLQTIEFNLAGNVLSLVANQFVLAAGTYLAIGMAPPTQTFCRFRIRNVTDSLSYQGIQTRTLNNSASVLPMSVIFPAPAGKTWAWQYYAQNDGGGGDFGYPMTTGDDEIYKSLALIKIG